MYTPPLPAVSGMVSVTMAISYAASVVEMLLMRSGDVEPKPGASKNPIVGQERLARHCTWNKNILHSRKK